MSRREKRKRRINQTGYSVASEDCYQCVSLTKGGKRTIIIIIRVRTGQVVINDTTRIKTVGLLSNWVLFQDGKAAWKLN